MGQHAEYTLPLLCITPPPTPYTKPTAARRTMKGIPSESMTSRIAATPEAITLRTVTHAKSAQCSTPTTIQAPTLYTIIGSSKWTHKIAILVPTEGGILPTDSSLFPTSDITK